MMKLNMGCGDKYLKGYTNLDFNKDLKCDVYHDLTIFPYPFQDNTFDKIISHHVMEHLKIEEPYELYKELHRILKPNGILEIRTPHQTGNNNYNTQYHINRFGCFSWDYLCKMTGMWDKNYMIDRKLFEKIERKLYWEINNEGIISKLLSIPANIIPHSIVERTFIYWFGGYNEILIRLKAIKCH